MGFLSSLTGGDIGKASLNALGQNKDLIKGFQTTGNNIINTGEDKSAAAINSGIAGYQPWVDSGTAANTMYDNALGLNGDAGNTAATDAFHTSPGYDFTLQQGTDAALRGASAAGMLNSGNTLTALQKYGTGVADQEYGSWLDRLNGVSGQGLTAAGGQATGDANLATLYQGTADDRLGLESGVTQGLEGINTDTAQVKEQQTANKGSFLSGLLSTGLSLGTKAATGALF